MNRLIKTLLLLAGTVAVLQTTGFADEVRMQNGDRITGTVVNLKEGLLTFKTDYAGTIVIDWKEVDGLQTDDRVDVLLRDERRFSAAFPDSGEETAMFLSASGGLPVTADMDDIKALNPEPPDPDIRYSGRVNAGISITDGNTQQNAFSSDGDLTARADNDRWTLDWRMKNETTEGKKTADRIAGNAKYDYFITQKWYALTHIGAERDDINNLDMRVNMGIGTGYQFIETQTDKLSAEVGISQVAEDFGQAANPKYFAQRWAINANFLLGRTGPEFFHQHDGLLSFEKMEDVTIRSVTGFRMPLYNQLNSTVQIRWDWQSNPEEGLRNSDVDYMLTLGYKF